MPSKKKPSSEQVRISKEIRDLIEDSKPEDAMSALLNMLVSTTHLHGFHPMETMRNVAEGFLAWEDVAAKVRKQKGLH